MSIELYQPRTRLALTLKIFNRGFVKNIFVLFSFLLVAGCSTKQSPLQLALTDCKPQVEGSSIFHATEAEISVRIAPLYPSEAYNDYQQGWVKLSFIITTDGGTKNIEVIDSSPKAVFDQASIQALEQWKFIPKQINCQYIESEAIQTLQFNLSQ